MPRSPPSVVYRAVREAGDVRGTRGAAAVARSEGVVVRAVEPHIDVRAEGEPELVGAADVVVAFHADGARFVLVDVLGDQVVRVGAGRVA